jgi:hypothetical protein
MPLWLTIILAAVIVTAVMFVWTFIARPFTKGFSEGMKDEF